MNDTIILLIFQLLLIPTICATLAYLISRFILKNSQHSTYINYGIVTGIVIDILFICLLFYAIKKMT
jgi:uncharacterized membrane protein YwzB